MTVRDLYHYSKETFVYTNKHTLRVTIQVQTLAECVKSAMEEPPGHSHQLGDELQG